MNLKPPSLIYNGKSLILRELKKTNSTSRVYRYRAKYKLIFQLHFCVRLITKLENMEGKKNNFFPQSYILTRYTE